MQQVLVIGAGTMGSVHAEAYAKMGNVHLAGIVDVQIGKARQLADQCHTAAFSTFEDAMAELPEVDVIDICLPTPLHKE